MVGIVSSRRVRGTPFSAGVEAAGAQAYTVYNHMLLPSYFESYTADYRHLKEHVQVWDVAVERQVSIKGPDALRLMKERRRAKAGGGAARGAGGGAAQEERRRMIQREASHYGQEASPGPPSRGGGGGGYSSMRGSPEGGHSSYDEDRTPRQSGAGGAYDIDSALAELENER